ncbi:hypothetical protein [Diaminobutyricibacter sp. McL0608]|uniref:hypothetical protein n=1 Tax=Leifsonia sp. McL0608 TaxID=3143537 RepID=UPI0031F32EA6
MADSESAQLIAAAHAAGVALLAVDPALTWGELYTLISTLHAACSPGETQFDDLFTLADQLAADIGGAVAIEDLSMRVLAYSTIEGQRIDDQRMEGILRRRVPRYTADAEEYLSVMRSEAAIWSHEPHEHLPRLAMAVRAHGQALGSIWVVQGDRPLKLEAAETLAEAARAAAPHLARINLAADEVRRHRDES